MRILSLTLNEAIEVAKALSNDTRMDILDHLSSGPKNVNELADLLGIPFSTAASNIKLLEQSGLITAEIVPGRGNQKVSSKRYDRIVIDLERENHPQENTLHYEFNIGEYVHCVVEPTCGLVSEKGMIHLLDEPRSFYEQERKEAQLIWFRAGSLEYHIPNRIPYGAEAEEISFSVELCSEAPYHHNDWPSDITCWINDQEIGYWTSPGDFGGERGFLTPDWWESHNTQFGYLKYWKVTKEGSYIDGTQISSVTVEQLNLLEKPYISLKLGVKEDAINQGGMNIFGPKFGNYEQGIKVHIHYKNNHPK